MADYKHQCSTASSSTANHYSYPLNLSPYPETTSTEAAQLFTNFSTEPRTTLFDQYLQSIQDMDGLTGMYLWDKDWRRKKGLELFKVLRDYGGYSGPSWWFTSGAANPLLSNNIQRKHSSYPSSFARGGKFESIQIPGSSIVVDVPHFNAAISKYLDDANDDAIVPSEWASWAGDIFTYADALQNIRDSTKISIDSITSIANKYIGGNDDTFSRTFDSKDFYADIDARNIAHLIKRGWTTYEAMNDYYRNQKFDRFNLFVNSYGSWSHFVNKVNSHYFFPLRPCVTSLFANIAKRAFINKIQMELRREMGLD